MKECKTCKYFINHYLQTAPWLTLGTIRFVENAETGELNTIEEPVLIQNEPGTGICRCEFSEFYNSGIHEGNLCMQYELKSDNDDIKEETEIIDNYICDGQLSFVINSDNTLELM